MRRRLHTESWRTLGRLVTGVAVIVLVSALRPLPRVPAQAPIRVFVYANTDLSSQVLRRRLEAELKSMQVAVFGRLRDFHDAVAAGQPDLVIAPSALLSDMGMAVHIRGLSGGSPTEPYVLVSREPATDPQRLTQATIGVVDMLGPVKMAQLVNALLAGVRPAQVRRVAKPADLIALLRLDLAQAVLVPRRLVNDLRAGSEMSVSVMPLPHVEVGLLAAHLREPARLAFYLEHLRRLSADLNRKLGVDEWR